MSEQTEQTESPDEVSPREEQADREREQEQQRTEEQKQEERAHEARKIDDGWLLVHEQPEETIVLSETQGRTQLNPAVYRAEKQVNGSLVTVEADSEKLLQERIEAYEANVEAFKTDPVGAAPAPAPVFYRMGIGAGDDDPHTEQVDVNLETVITPEGRFTEEEWSARASLDVIVTPDGQTVYHGVGDADAIERARRSVDEAAQEIENQRVFDPDDKTTSRQVSYDTSMNFDSPGQSAGGTIRIAGDADTREQAAEEMNRFSKDAENERVAASEKTGRRPVEDVDLTGLDVGLGRHGDLGTENPPPGHTTEYVEGLAEREVMTSEGPTMAAVRDEQAARIDAQLGAAQQARDEGLSTDDADRSIQQAGADAAAEAAAPDDSDDEPEATPAAKEAAEELGVDLTEIAGTGTDGKITKADVEQHADG